MKKVIPSLLTCMSLISGSISIVYSLQKEMLVYAGYFIIIAAIFDFLDGFFARLFKTVSDFGVHLDSLADVVSFGIAPSMILYRLILFTLVNTAHGSRLDIDSPGIENELILYSAFLIGVFSALRLARFNIDNEQKTYFKGLPTPASAILIASIGINHDIYFLLFKNNENVYNIYSLVTLIVLIAVICFLLVSNIRMFSLKFKNTGFRGNGIRYIFLLLSALIIILFGIKGLAPVIALYIILSLINNWIIKME
jgi:CDP-diacylglycerol--serine O-phosphatidyltransferase